MRDVSVCWVFVLIDIGGRVPIFFGDAGVLIVWSSWGSPAVILLMHCDGVPLLMRGSSAAGSGSTTRYGSHEEQAPVPVSLSSVVAHLVIVGKPNSMSKPST